MSALRLSGLRVPFGHVPGLHPISLDVEAGERVAIVGASGAGKTTLLRAVAGLVPVIAGRVEIGGRDVTGSPPERRDAVYLNQTPVLFPHLDVFENVAFPLRVRGRTSAEVRDRVDEVLSAVGMSDLARRAPTRLSGGQRHRVALARAIAARPSVLLLDEPLSALDPSLREEVREVILRVQAAERPALLLVTHDIDEAGVMADRIGVLIDRRIAQLDRPADLFARPASLDVARFLGFPNRVAGTVRADGLFECPLGAVERWDPPTAPPGPAVGVFQPEAARIGSQGAPGRVLEVRHRLRTTTVVVEVAGSRIEAVVRGRRPAPGDEVRVSLNPARVIVFPAEEGSVDG
jgi:ABC-type sugar transport system ATPase subunit